MGSHPAGSHPGRSGALLRKALALHHSQERMDQEGNNPVVAEGLEIILADVSHEKAYGKNGNYKGRGHAGGQNTDLRSREGYKTRLPENATSKTDDVRFPACRPEGRRGSLSSMTVCVSGESAFRWPLC